MDIQRDHGEYLGEVEHLLGAALGGGGEARGDTLMGAARHLCFAGGKRARPLLVRVFGAVVGARRGLVEVGGAAELIHAASLLHDDVVDGGMFRRGVPTVNARWGNAVAVMTGDMLLAIALGLLRPLEPALTHGAIDVVAQMTRAAIAEVEARGEVGTSVEQLRLIAEGKTGALFGWCGRAAALLAGNPEAAGRFDAFGRRLGVAFQIADDVRDLTGVEEGKPRFADVQSKNPSLPIVLALEDQGLRRRFREVWAHSAMTPERARELGAAVLCSGAVERAVGRLQGEIEAAVEALGPYASAPQGAELVAFVRQLALGLGAHEGIPVDGSPAVGR